jgi:hypothetical protein
MPCEVTFSGFAGGEYLILPAEFGSCGYAALQCCGLKDGISLKDNGIPLRLGKLQIFFWSFLGFNGNIFITI